MNFPSELKYTKEHEWAKITGNHALIGITEHAQSALGDIVFVETPKMGRVLKAGETFGVVESIKAVSDLYSPLEGKVAEVNPILSQEPALLNQDPYGKGWIIKIELSNPNSVDHLMDSNSYSDFVSKIK